MNAGCSCLAPHSVLPCVLPGRVAEAVNNFFHLPGLICNCASPQGGAGIIGTCSKAPSEKCWEQNEQGRVALGVLAKGRKPLQPWGHIGVLLFAGRPLQEAENTQVQFSSIKGCFAAG